MNPILIFQIANKIKIKNLLAIKNKTLEFSSKSDNQKNDGNKKAFLGALCAELRAYRSRRAVVKINRA